MRRVFLKDKVSGCPQFALFTSLGSDQDNSHIAEEGAPAVVRLIATIASRFGATVSQKAAASAVPIIGAAGGALINSIFMDHFQNIARGHFIMRNFERKYGLEKIHSRYLIDYKS